MTIKTLSPAQALRPAFRKAKVSRAAIERMKHELPLLLDRTAGKVSESTLRDHLQTFLRGVAFPSDKFLVQSEVRRMDTVIHDGPKRKDPVGVIIEAKTTDNAREMFSAARPNVKALHELALYFMRERHAGNTAIKQLVITNGETIYLFPDAEFERIFWNKKTFRKQLLAADADAGKNNPIAYEIIERHVAATDDELQCTVLHLEKFRVYCEDKDDSTDDRLLNLCKLLSPAHLLRQRFSGDSNHLDKDFYRELLHLIGLEEFVEDSKGNRRIKGSGKKVIARAEGANRHAASLLENTLQVATKENRFRNVTGFNAYGSNEEERRFAVALELCLTWVNRVLFLKLLETQLIGYHDNATDYRFLTPRRIPDFDALNTLFFDVLNKPVHEREAIVADFARVPYLNSSLFEISALEDQVLRVNSLKDQFRLPLSEKSVLRRLSPGEGDVSDVGGVGSTGLPPLEYLFRFLDAYDFGGEGRASIQEDNKKLINASVLGLIFEKINGYRDGSFYTPGFITEYMCRETIRRAVVQKFRADTEAFAGFDSEEYDDLKNYLARDNYKGEVRVAANTLVNTVTVCDPAVGSGHFLVSALNELIATKSDLGILGAAAGAREVGITAEVANDELLLSDRKTGELYEYRVTTLAGGQLSVMPEVQAVQETLFHEKRTLIENCLFGVDLNPNSVKICRLRLWIELLKSAYYNFPHERSEQTTAAAKSLITNRLSLIPYLETLPNIDINIKQGNSLISRFALNDDLGTALADSGLTMDDYRRAVKDYHRASGAEEKQRLLDLIDEVKNNFRSHISRNDKKIKILAAARGKMQQLQSMLDVGDLFGSVDKDKVNKELHPLQNRVAKLEEEVEAIRTNAIYDNAFEWRFEFPAVLGDDGGYLGFDVVVGNPPYVVLDKKVASQNHLDFYKKSEEYQAAKGGKLNLYKLFLVRIPQLLNGPGFASQIFQISFLADNEATKIRKYYIDNNMVQKLVAFPERDSVERRVFDEAKMSVCILNFTKEKNLSNDFYFGISYDKKIPVQTDFIRLGKEVILGLDHVKARIPLSSNAEIGILTKLSQTTTKLGDISRCYQGELNNSVFKQYITDESNSHRLITGAQVQKYRITDTPSQGRVQYVNETFFEDNTSPKISHKDFDRIVMQGITGVNEKTRIKSTLINAGPTLAHSCNYIIIRKKDQAALIGLLNSCLMNWMFKMFSTNSNVNSYEIETLPIADRIDELSALTTQILQKKQQDPTADTSVLEAEIDVLVYKLYGLSYPEVLVVDSGFGMSEGEYDKIEVV